MAGEEFTGYYKALQQGNGVVFEFTTATINTKIANLTAKAAAVNIPELPAEPTTAEQAAYDRAIGLRDGYLQCASEYTALRDAALALP